MAATTPPSKESVELCLATEWKELESDPGLFTLLLQDIGVRGVKVQEVYDVAQTFQDKVYGFVFLFQWIEERRARKKIASGEEGYMMSKEEAEGMFFAHQIVVNSCATHALLSILLNQDDIDIGPTLEQLKQFSQDLDPENKGYAIGNMPELAQAHNCHAKPEVPVPSSTQNKRGVAVTTTVADTFHYVSYTPINNKLVELDGLKSLPISHGPWGRSEHWTDLFRRVITRRLSEGDGIQFNLMALVADPIARLSRELETYDTRQRELLDEAYRLAREVLVMESKGDHECHKKEREPHTENGKLVQPSKATAEPTSEDIHKHLEMVSTWLLQRSPSAVDTYSSGSVTETTSQEERLRSTVACVLTNNKLLEASKAQFQDEIDTRKRYHLERSRRTHDYDEFITEFIIALEKQGLLPQRLLEGRKRKSSKQSALGKNKKLNHHKSKSRTQPASNGAVQ